MLPHVVLCLTSVAISPQTSIPSTRGRLVIVEGNISAGKSTLCRSLADALGYELFLEPMVTNPYLELYYGDAVKYGLKMQLWLLRQRFIMYCRALRVLTTTGGNTAGVVLDRSLMSDVVFADKNLRDGNITPEGYEQYQELRNHLMSLVPLPDTVVYLDVSAEICHQRIHGLRQRECESGIPLAYLAGLDECYHTFLADMASAGCSVLSFDWSEFGDAKAIAAAVAALPFPLSNSSSNAPDPKLLRLVASDASALTALSRDYSGDAAPGPGEQETSPDASPADNSMRFQVLDGLAAPDMCGADESLREEAEENAAALSLPTPSSPTRAQAEVGDADGPVVSLESPAGKEVQINTNSALPSPTAVEDVDVTATDRNTDKTGLPPARSLLAVLD